MAISEKELSLEQKRLDEIIGILEAKINEYSHLREKLKKEYRELNKELWENVGVIETGDTTSYLQYIQMIKTNLTGAENAKKIWYNLLLLRQSPYFGRMDLRYDENEYEKIYIGTSTLQKNRDILICDWRADICTLFYEDSFGSVTYESPGGTVPVELLLKRQIKIEKDKIIGAFDTQIKIDDEILQEVLSKNTDEKMSVIIRTIQKNQNSAIRDDSAEVLLVTGPAGSGKTSVALHRIAWLLYKYRDRLTADQIVSLSPNDIFNDYISEVLPDLGEQNMVMKTLTGLGKQILGKKYRLFTNNEQMERYLKTKNINVNYSDIFWKNSTKFCDSLVSYIDRYINNGPEFQDIVLDGNVLIKKDTLTDLYQSGAMMQYAYKMERLKTYTDRILSSVKKDLVEKKAEEIWDDGGYIDKKEVKALSRIKVSEKMSGVYSYINKISGMSPVVIYIEFLKSVETDKNRKDVQHTINALNKNIVPYEDMAPCIYIFSRLFAEDDHRKNIKHVVIDEVQDYTPIQLTAVKEYYRNANLTLLGDINQAINPLSNIGTIDKLSIIYKDKTFKHIHMLKSYRSTYEITEFCNFVGKVQSDDYINRHGEIPRIVHYENTEEMLQNLIEILNSSKDQESIALITRSKKTAINIFELLKDLYNIKLIDKNDHEFYHGVIVIPAYLAKGLEFDTAIVITTKDDYFKGEDERKLFYTACSRALHRLFILQSKEAKVEFVDLYLQY